MTTTDRQREVRLQYCSFISEIRHRLDFLYRLLETDEFELPPLPVAELGYLELRMTCETLALACLVVHGDDIGALTARMRSAYHADAILNKLERLHPNFFPEPGFPIQDLAVSGGRKFVPATFDYMTKPMLLKLYWDCGEHLHRGTYESIGDLPMTPIDPIREARTRFVALLKFHRIALLNTTRELWVQAVHPDTGDVRATLERPVSDEDAPPATDDDLPG